MIHFFFKDLPGVHRNHELKNKRIVKWQLLREKRDQISSRRTVIVVEVSDVQLV